MKVAMILDLCDAASPFNLQLIVSGVSCQRRHDFGQFQSVRCHQTVGDQVNFL